MTIRNLLLAGTAVMAMSTASAFAADPAPASQSNDVIRSGTPSDTMSPSSPRTTANNADRAANSSFTVLKNNDTVVAPYNITVGKLEGTDVIGANNKKIGDVEDVLADSSGKAVAVSVDAGSYFKMNKKEVVMQLKDLQMRDGKLHTSMTEAQVGALPEHND